MRFKILILKLILLKHAIGYNILQSQISFKYDIEANIELVPDVLNNNADAITKWNLENTSLKVQRVNDDTINMQIMIENDKEELKPLLMPFKLISLNESSKFLMQHPQKALVLYKDEPIWSANIKRAIVSLFQIEGNSENGAFVSNEFGLSGLCPTEYFVVNLTDSLYISKLYDIDRCSIPGGIFHIRSNIPLNYCEIDKNKAVHAVTSRLGNYVLTKLPNSQYLLKSIYAESKSNVLATESYYPQFIFSKVNINFASQELLTDENQIKFNESEKMVLSDFTYVVPLEATGGRNVKSSEQIIKKVIEMLKELAQYLQDKNLNFDDPYLESISEIFRLLETMNYESLKKLYDQLDIGTSYSQEMCKNIFLEILPRVGNSATILLTKYLVMETKVRSTIAVQLLTALPFFVSELSADLVKECEVFLHIVDRPDVRHTAVLSYSTLIYKAYVARIITSTQFERYVKMIFDLFLNSFDYEQQMLYLEAMGNLQLGNVNKYLQPIIQADYSQTTDIRFLAIFATMPTAHTRSAEIFETYWPIFNTKSTPLQLRIAAFTMLLVSAETPGRILGLFNVIKKENCPHMINFYRTTILSISESTYSCLAHLKRLVLYMRRHLPPAPPKKYWITGNYIFDYKDRKFQIGSMLQLLMIGDRKNNLPLIAFIKFDTEAMGRFTGQLGLYIKARGLNDAVLDRLNTINAETLKVDELTKILRMMKIQPMLSTPLHLEIIIQYEGKTILSYYLNQTTFHNLTDGNIINRINAILHTDSHINMQLIRRPFVIKHNFPTLLGTPAAILIENTMIASIRGSTSTLQNNAMEQIIRNNQVDLRYSSYAVAKINSYDPIRDIEFSTIREQGFLVYLPLNNEMKLNLLQKFLSLSFYRKETLTSGLALKSRTRSFSGSKEISKKRSDIPTHYFNIEDIGLNFLIGHNVESSKENLMFLFESDVATSATKTPFSFVQNVLTFTSMIQLTSVHIARDKHFIILLTNEPQSKVVINLKYDLEDLHAMAKEERVVKIDCNLLHILNYDNTHSKQLHKWELSTKYTTFKNKASQAINMSFNRESSVGDKWKVCVTSTFDSFAHFIKPFKITSKIYFGNYVDTMQSCPVDKSKVDLILSIGEDLSIHSNETFNHIISNEAYTCTKEIVRFTPSPYFEKCNASEFDKILSIRNAKLEMNFNKMPPTFYDVMSRLDHFVAAFVQNKVDKLNLSESLKLDIELPINDEEETVLKINNNTVSLPFPSYNFKYGSFDQFILDYGLTSICTLYQKTLNSFLGKDLIIEDENVQQTFSNNGEMLLVAECTDLSRFAVFVRFKNNSNEFLHVKIYVGGNYILVGSDNQPVIYYDNKRYDLREMTFEHPLLEDDFRVLLNEHDIIEIENDLLMMKIQYNMKNLISISLSSMMTGKLCGLCTSNNNKMC